MTDWTERANCRGTDPELFFSRRPGDAKRAKRVCAGCWVAEQCLRNQLEYELPQPGDGLETNMRLRDGVFGGLTATERFALQFPEEATRIRERERARSQRLLEYKRAKYAAMSPEERAAYRGKVDTPEKREAKRERDRRSAANKKATVAA